MILALDPGLNSCGWALFNGGQLVDAGVIVTKADKESSRPVGEMDASRARAMFELLVMQVDRHAAVVEEIRFEGHGAARSFRAAREPGVCIGVIGSLAAHFTAEVTSVSPARVKQIVQEAVDAARAPCKPLRAKVRELREVADRSVTNAERAEVEIQIMALEKELAPLERARAKAEKQAIVGAVMVLHPEIEARIEAWGKRAEHVADAIAVFHAVSGTPRPSARAPAERQRSLGL